MLSGRSVFDPRPTQWHWMQIQTDTDADADADTDTNTDTDTDTDPHPEHGVASSSEVNGQTTSRALVQRTYVRTYRESCITLYCTARR
jgi:hypothetical protein